ncbi:hypothetical protein [Sulfidibacter corallicola]|uniref:Uncharacterized protein n=1 Tax=Sulfidibacter corallicola TaxID=2818388 RepID=A0A8A4TQ99_SULCO|nr:hypothetical protein [Sulfidibacter corallicola]QTD51101.1 hypothetical protein J3U87_01415 [Sulfidibacter corallicola]
MNKSTNQEGIPPELADRLCIMDNAVPVEFVRSEGLETPIGKRPGPFYDDTVMIHTIHGGDVIHPSYYQDLTRIFPRSQIEKKTTEYYAVEKDWGANQVAWKLVEYLGMAGYWRVNTARAVMDFGRFPGITPPGASYQNRFAISYPFSYALDFMQKRRLLELEYDAISRTYERVTPSKVVKIAIHTYDPFNPGEEGHLTGTLRPEISILSRSASFQEQKRMPIGLFDRLYPDDLGDYTADRKLTNRLALTLQKGALGVSINFPYLMPDGCVEIRSQVWYFFNYLKKVFGERHPDTQEKRAYKMVWDLLLDTNLRSSSSESLRSFIHMYRTAPRGYEEIFHQARLAYEHISNEFHEHRQALINSFINSKHRLSTLGIEVRKDLVWRFKDKHARQPVFGPEGVRWENIKHIAKLLAEGIVEYFETDQTATRYEVSWLNRALNQDRTL